MAFTSTTYLAGFGPGGSSSNKEDVLDMIINIDPYDTPFTTSAPKTQARLTTHEWLNDTLEATSTAGAIEGADHVGVSAAVRTRITNHTQIFRKDISVSRTQRVVLTAGRRDEYAYQLAENWPLAA